MSYTLTFWGTRGSIPTPGPHTARYGGNTPCIGVTRPGSPHHVILDAGSGLRPLGHEIMLQGGGAVSADLLISHTHWDHIQGLPFFKPLSVPGSRVRIYGARQEGVGLEDILRRQMDPMVFPVPLRALAAELTVTEVERAPFEIEGFRVTPFRLRHPGTTLGYRLEARDGGREIAYVTDNELGPGGNYPVGAEWRRDMVAWLGGIETLVHDAMYAEHIIAARAGWGHSTPRQAVDLAAESGARRLLLFHHEPEHTDDALDRLLGDTCAYARRVAPRLVVEAAVEGMQLTL
jgi:phosphoribosyl 1,2-cyclic phosphodiesterase